MRLLGVVTGWDDFYRSSHSGALASSGEKDYGQTAPVSRRKLWMRPFTLRMAETTRAQVARLRIWVKSPVKEKRAFDLDSAEAAVVLVTSLLQIIFRVSSC